MTPERVEHRQTKEALPQTYEELKRLCEQQAVELSKAKNLLKQESAGRKQAKDAFKESEERFRQAEQSLRRQTEYLGALHETALGLASRAELPALLQAIVQRAGALLDTQHGYVYLIEPDGSAMDMQIGTGVYADLVGYRLGPGEGLIGKIWENGYPLVVSDYRTWSNRASDPKFDALRYVVGIPLKSGTRIIGVLGLAYIEEQKEFGYDEIAVLSQFAALASIALDNRDLYVGLQQELGDRRRAEEMLQQRNRELALLNQASRELSSTLNLDQVLSAFLEEIRHLLNITACSVWLIDPETEELVCEQVSGPSNDLVRGWRLALGEGLAGWVARHGEILSVPDARIDERHFKGVDQRTGLDLRSILGIPLQIKQDVIGVLQVMDTKVEAFGPEELRLLEALAASAAFAIENARLYEQAHQEITERKRAETALRTSEEKYRTLFESSPEAIILLDLNGTILDCNPATTEISHLSKAELIGRSFAELSTLHKEDGPKYTDILARLARGEEITSFEAEAVRGEGEPCWFEIFPALLKRNGNVSAIQLIVRDITERKLMEQTLLRTERLAAMGHLAAALAHEINNPLQSISSSMELALDFPLAEKERQEYLEAVRQEIERLMGLTGRVLDFSRPPQIERQPTSVAEVVRYALALATKQLAHSHIQVCVELPDHLPPVRASQDQLTQVFLNLIINAREAMTDGGTLRISAQVINERIEVAFADSGPGISPDVLPTLFEAFYTTKKEGTGLGLAVSYSIVQQHGGKIVADNVPGSGAVFTVILPLALPETSSLQKGE